MATVGQASFNGLSTWQATADVTKRVIFGDRIGQSDCLPSSTSFGYHVGFYGPGTHLDPFHDAAIGASSVDRNDPGHHDYLYHHFESHC